MPSSEAFAPALFTGRIKRLDVDFFPRGFRAIHRQVEVIVIFAPAHTLLRPCLLQSGKRLCRPAGTQETVADLRAHVRPGAVFHGISAM